MAIKSFKPKTGGVGRKFVNAEEKKREKLYDHQWEKYRSRFLKENPRCYCCGAKATVVDHLVPHKGDIELFKKLDNHIPLCKLHHDTATGLFDTRYVVGKGVTGKVNWMKWERARFEIEGIVRVRPLPSYSLD